MAREFFKNLPNTTAPLTAPRLNNLLDGDEAMGNIVVDSIKGKNLFNKDFATLNSALATDGSIVARNGYMISDYIEVEENTDYYLSNVSGSNQVRTCGYFNSSKSFISYESITGDVVVSGKITTPSNTKYIRVSVNMNNSNIQVEKGSIATNYAPYMSFAYKEPIIISKTGTGTPTSFTLPEDISNYKYIDFVVARSSDYGQAICRVYYDTWYTPNVGHANMFYTDSNSSFFIESIKFSVSRKNVTITAKTINIFGQTIDPSDNIAFRLLAVYGYK